MATRAYDVSTKRFAESQLADAKLSRCCGLSERPVTCSHYAVSVSWAFLYGYTYALAATQEAGSTYYEDPLPRGSISVS